MKEKDLSTLRRASEVLSDLNQRLHGGESQWLSQIASDLNDICASTNTLERMAQRAGGWASKGASE